MQASPKFRTNHYSLCYYPYSYIFIYLSQEPRKKTVQRKFKRSKKYYKKNSETGNNCQVHSVGDPLTDKILLFLHSHKEVLLCFTF